MKFSIVTPSYNSEIFIRETIESVVTQKGDFSIEYIVLDNCSTDSTPKIVREFQDRLAAGTMHIGCQDVQLRFISERDSGMYEAIGRGFALANGDIFAWINSDDIYLPGAFDIVRRALEAYPEISWIKGITSYINPNSTVFSMGECHLYRDDFIRAGIYGPSLYFIQQDSVFWTAELWRKSGGVDPKLSLAGDYFLWKKFAEFAPLYSINAFLSCFRKTATQKSANIETYWKEINDNAPPDKRLMDALWRYNRRINTLPSLLRSFFFNLKFGRYPHYLLLLKDEITPELVIDDDYYALKRRLS